MCWTVDNTNFNEVNSKNVLIGLLMIKCKSWKENVFYKFKFRLVDPFLCIFISFLVLCLLFSKNHQKDDFDQQMACKSPVCWSKYTTVKAKSQGVEEGG